MAKYTLKLKARPYAEVHIVLTGDAAENEHSFAEALDVFYEYTYHVNDVISEIVEYKES